MALNPLGPPPLTARILVENDAGPIGNGQWFIRFLTSVEWSKWLGALLVPLVQRPTLTVNVAFPLTPAGSSSDFIVQFPAGSVNNIDIPCMSSPVPLNGTTFTCHISTQDRVIVRFNNYSGIAMAYILPHPFTITVLKNS